MSTVNLYKVDKDRIKEFYELLDDKMERIGEISINRSSSNDSDIYMCTLFLFNSDEEKAITWNWVLNAFNKDSIYIRSSPKAVIVIVHQQDTYAVTFGHAFYYVDKYCDRDFGFSYGRKLRFNHINTTTLTSPGLKRNKVVNVFTDYNDLEFDSGESFAKLKAKEVVPDNFNLYNPLIEIGASIHFNVENNSIETIIDIIIHVEKIIATEEDKCRIPVFFQIKDVNTITDLNQKLINDISNGKNSINFSELEIIGVNEVFDHNDSEYLLKLGRKKLKVLVLDIDNIRCFCEDNDIISASDVLKVSVIYDHDGECVERKIYDMIEYIIDEEQCLLSQGKWYRYNTDYLEYLHESIAEIDAVYQSEYDFPKKEYEKIIDELYEKNKNSEEFVNKSKSEIKGILKKKYYTELVFNEMRAKKNGFIIYDRQTNSVGKNKVETMDLYKDGCMFAVKIGDSSEKLCYVVDQSLISVKLYKDKELSIPHKIDKVCLWIVLERKKHIEDNNGKPDINKLKMLMLKNRINQWKKEVRLLGFQPIIWVNYRM